MRREVKRVPMDFNWPLGKIWEGYLSDEEPENCGPLPGEGWQLWETVTEGSPISPVFGSAESLAEWMVRGGSPWTREVDDYDTALHFALKGWAPSFVLTPSGEVLAGVEWVGRQNEGE